MLLVTCRTKLYYMNLLKKECVLFALLIFFRISSMAEGSDSVGWTQPCIPCEQLLNLQLPEIKISAAETMHTPELMESNGGAYCKISGTIGKEIDFELLLPYKWNKRFVMGGGGGFVGYMMNRAEKYIQEGFATVGTDTGHKGTDGKWALNNPERQLNFGHLAVHRTATVSKGIIYHFYGLYPQYSYFIGLSRGGGQAMMEAQRYPEDFDGIVAGAPAFNWIGQAAKFIKDTQAIYPDPTKDKGPVITKDNLQLLQKKILERCDEMDGVRDSILNDPRECVFDINNIPRCPGNVAGSGCLTQEQFDAIKVIYSGLGTGVEQLHQGFPFGGEDEKTGWMSSIVGPNKGSFPYPSWQAFYGMETFRYLIFNDPNWNYLDYDFSRVYDDTRYAAAYLDATQTDYSPFKKSGGKMIIYQGWIDPLISALDIINHYEKANYLDPELPEYIRLFMLPGVSHIGGNGPGKTDWFHLIQDWVERGIAPNRVVVSKLKDNETVMTRPVYPYPKKATYNGKGDPGLESSFK